MATGENRFNELNVRGIVLDTSEINEYDKRMLILSDELGKITVFANGARRAGNRLAAVAQRFVMGSFQLRTGRNSYTLLRAEIDIPFRELSLDVEKMCYASYMCELAGHFTREGLTARDELNLLFVSFRALLAGNISSRMIRAIFECKLLDIEGEGFQVAEYEKGGVRLKEASAYTIRYILSRRLEELYSFRVQPDVEDDVIRIITQYTEKHCDRHFKSLDILLSLE